MAICLRQLWHEMKRLIPDTIAARTMLVLIVGLTISHVLSVAFYLNDRTSELMFTGGEHTGERIATISRLVENASHSERLRIVELADDPDLRVTWGRESAIEGKPDTSWQTDVFGKAMAAHLNGDGSMAFRLSHAGDSSPEPRQSLFRPAPQAAGLGEAFMISLQLPDESWLNFVVPVSSPESFWSLRLALSMSVMLVAVGLLSALIVHHLTRPLSTFARAAQRLGTDVKAPPIPERGPAEVRQAIRAFNEMQERIRRFVEDRTQMLAAISHDLGTPITRLRLRAEFVEDPEQQEKMLADLNDMEHMVFSALSFARDEAACEPYSMVDLRTLLQRVCNDMTDAGYAVELAIEEEPVPFGCRPAALRRALTNLVDNAVKYGAQAQVAVHESEGGVVVSIDDNGPGIPESLQEEAFKPFRRLEGSRNRETGGTGLGLTVARSIVRAHGGDMTLLNRSEGGLQVNVYLPRQ